MDANSAKVPSQKVGDLIRQFETPSAAPPKADKGVSNAASKALNVGKLDPKQLEPFQATKAAPQAAQARTKQIFNSATGASIEHLQMRAGQLTEEKAAQLADDLCDLPLSEQCDPKQETALKEIQEKILNAAPASKNQIEKKFKALESLRNTAKDVTFEKGVSVSSFLKQQGVTEEDIQSEAKFFDLDLKTAEMKIAKRTLILQAVENRTEHGGVLTKTAENLQTTPCSIKAAYRLFKENVRGTTQDTSLVLKDKKITLLSTDRNVFLQPQKNMGEGAFKATFGLKQIFGRMEFPMVSQMPKNQLPDYTTAKPEKVPSIKLNEMPSMEEMDLDGLEAPEEEVSGSVVINDNDNEGTMISSGSMVSSESVVESGSMQMNETTKEEVVPDFMAKRSSEMEIALKKAQLRNKSFEAMTMDDLSDHEQILNERLSLEIEKKSPQEVLDNLANEIHAVKNRREKYQEFKQRMDVAKQQRSQNPIDDYDKEIQVQMNLRGDYIEPLYKVITTQGPDNTATKVILKPRAGKALPPNDFHKEPIAPHDLETLFEAAENKALSPNEFIFAMGTLLDAMKGIRELGNQNSIHRDLKLENVLISSNGVGMITDFGTLVKSEDDPEKLSYAGTPSYSSPEQAAVLSNEMVALDVTAQSDVWSLGMILQQALTAGGLGDHPVWNSSIARSGPHMMLSHLGNLYSNRVKQESYQKSLAEYVEQAPNDLAKELRQLIADCTQVKPSQRCTIDQAIERFGKIIEKAEASPEKLYNTSIEMPLVA